MLGGDFLYVARASAWGKNELKKKREKKKKKRQSQNPFTSPLGLRMVHSFAHGPSLGRHNSRFSFFFVFFFLLASLFPSFGSILLIFNFQFFFFTF